MLLFLPATCCRGRHSLSDIGVQLEPISVSALSDAKTGMARRLEPDAALNRRVKELSAGLRKSKE